MAVDLKQLSRRILEECYGEGKLDYLDQVCDSSFVEHDPLTGDADIEGVKNNIRMYRAAFPDMKPAVLMSVVEGDCVVTQWRFKGTHSGKILGFAATGKPITVEGLSLEKFRGAKLVETINEWDCLSFLQQLGAIPRTETLERVRQETREHRAHV